MNHQQRFMSVLFTSSPNVLSGLNEGVTMPLHRVSLNRDTAAGIGCATRISFKAGGILVSVCVLLTKHWILDRRPGDISPYIIIGRTVFTFVAVAAHSAPLLLLSSLTFNTPSSSGRVGSEFTPNIGMLSSKNDEQFKTVPSPPMAIIRSFSWIRPRWSSSLPITECFTPIFCSIEVTVSTHCRWTSFLFFRRSHLKATWWVEQCKWWATKDMKYYET